MIIFLLTWRGRNFILKPSLSKELRLLCGTSKFPDKNIFSTATRGSSRPSLPHPENGWQGTFRLAILETLPVGKLSEHFHPSLGAPTKELYSMVGLVYLADFHDWNAQQAIEAYMFTPTCSSR